MAGQVLRYVMKTLNLPTKVAVDVIGFFETPENTLRERIGTMINTNGLCPERDDILEFPGITEKLVVTAVAWRFDLESMTPMTVRVFLN